MKNDAVKSNAVEKEAGSAVEKEAGSAVEKDAGNAVESDAGNAVESDAVKSICVSFGEGKYAVAGTAVLCGEDISLSFTGGTKPHIGAVSLAVYEPARDSATVSTIAVYTHRDGELSAGCAKKAAAAFRCTAAVSVGIHIDQAGPEELDILIRNFEQCRQRLNEKLALQRTAQG